MQFLSWFRDKNGNLHSEGACDGSADHQGCKFDPEATLRVALAVALQYECFSGYEGRQSLPDWCERCGGHGDDCLHCHTAQQLMRISTRVSQRTKALRVVQSNWPDAPEELLDLATPLEYRRMCV